MPLAYYTRHIMAGLREEEISVHHVNENMSVERARGRLHNAARRLGVSISTHLRYSSDTGLPNMVVAHVEPQGGKDAHRS